MFGTRSEKRIGLVVLMLWASCSVSSVSAATPPQHDLKTYSLPTNTNSADFSPDERMVVTENTEKEDQVDYARFRELVQLWDFRAGTLVRESVLQDTRLSRTEKKNYPSSFLQPRFARFSADGSLIAAYIDHSLFVLRASDLSLVNRVSVSGPSGPVHTYRGTTFVENAVVRDVELSPQHDLVALLWVRKMVFGRVEVYDLASGKQLAAWDTPQGWFHSDHGLAWHPNGEVLVLAVPNQTPCSSPDNTPDVFAFEARSGTLRAKLTTGLLVGGIAVTADDRLLAVDADCMRVFKDHDPKLRVFNLNTGKRLQEIPGRGTGIRYAVSVSRNGQRFIAFTGKMKVKFDWTDLVSHDVLMDKTFSVWNLSDYTGVVTSPNIDGLVPSSLTLSPQGHFALSFGSNPHANGASNVYELP